MQSVLLSNDANGLNPIRNEKLIDKKFRCSICSHLLIRPVQLTCGDRICQECVFVHDNVVKCRSCDHETLYSKNIFDKDFENDVQSLTVECSVCEWKGKLESLKHHLQRFHNYLICEFCKKIFSSAILPDEHDKSCMKILIKCSLKSCQTNQKYLRCNASKHYLTSEHQTALISYIKKRALHSEELNSSSEMMSPSTVSEKSGLTSSKISVLETQCKNDDDHNNNDTTVDEVLHTFLKAIDSCNNDLLRLNNESLELIKQFENLETTRTMVKHSIEELCSVLNPLSTNWMLLDEQLFYLSEASENKISTSFDGTLLWKIDRFNERMADAKSEKQVSIYSPPFWSGHTGYKMCARLYLNGDGHARHTHMSLFFVLMRGPYDSILQFPFDYKVIFCLFDQSDKRSHIVDLFRPDVRSSSFQRPTSNMNIASGIPKFVPLSTLEDPNNCYVRNNTMFIRVMIDFENIPKRVLPYACSLNPGLPVNIRQTMIRKEIDRTVYAT